MDKDAKWLAWFEQRFTEVAGTDRQIDFDEFKRALNVTQVSEPACVVTITITKRVICAVGHMLLIPPSTCFMLSILYSS